MGFIARERGADALGGLGVALEKGLALEKVLLLSRRVLCPDLLAVDALYRQTLIAVCGEPARSASHCIRHCGIIYPEYMMVGNQYVVQYAPVYGYA